MEYQEGPFALHAVAGIDGKKPNLWHADGYVHAQGEDRYLEQVRAGTEFETMDAALLAGIEAARAIARNLAPDDSWVKRNAEGRF